MKKTTVVIAGGGFAGLSAAMYFDKTLARREDVEVTPISRENFILFTPMLHEVAAGDLYDVTQWRVRIFEAFQRRLSRRASKIFRCLRLSAIIGRHEIDRVQRRLEHARQRKIYKNGT